MVYVITMPNNFSDDTQKSVGLPARPFLGCDWPVGDIAGMDLNLGPPDALLGALVLEYKYQPKLQLPQLSQGGEVTVGIRDGSAHVLRCLKVWYDMPSEVLFVALNLMDRFLTKMKVKPKHMACISVASFQLASRVVCNCEPLDVAVISQCKCTMGDLVRMQGIIANKLGQDNNVPITALTFLRLFHSLFSALDIGHVYARCVGSEDDIWQRLEIIACDAVCANFRPCEIALVLLCCQMDSTVPQLQPAPSAADVMRLVAFASHVQHLCKIPECRFNSCHEAVLAVVARYNGEYQMPHRQRLVWRVSQRTLKYLRPTDKLVKTLPTIAEHGQLHIPARARRGSCCSSDDSWGSV